MDKVISMVGMATKAGKTVSGEFMTEKAVKEHSAYLVLVAEDASDNTKKMFHSMCMFYGVPCYEYGTKEMIGHGMGKGMRASLAVLDQGFCNAIVKKLIESENCEARSKSEVR